MRHRPTTADPQGPTFAPESLRSALAAGACLALLLAGPARGERADAEPPDTASAAPVAELDRPLAAALAIVEERYLQPMGRAELVERALRAFLKELDPYSRYLNAQEWADFNSDLAAEYGGLGVTLRLDPESRLPEIERLLVGSAGGEAGIVPGDELLEVAGHGLLGKTLDEVIPWLIGSPGTVVEVVVRHPGEAAPVRLSVRRKVVKMPSVRGVRRDGAGRPDYWLDAARGLGYVRISHLAEDTVPEVESAVAALEAGGLRGLILDLRDSYGGLMRAAVGVADLFLTDGRILRDVGRDASTTYDATPGACTAAPMVVLINSGTASSSEFLAAALQDNRRALFVGQSTYGKARIQEKIALGPGLGGLILTTGVFERPSGRAVDRHDVPAGDRADGGAPGNSPGISPDSGLELIVEGAEYEAWSADAALRDGPVVLDAAAEAARPPDRSLELALTLFEERPADRADLGAPAAP